MGPSQNEWLGQAEVHLFEWGRLLHATETTQGLVGGKECKHSTVNKDFFLILLSKAISSCRKK